MAAKKKIFTRHSTLKFLIILLFFQCSHITFLPIPQAGDLFAQSVTWQKVLNNNYGGLNKIQQTNDGGYVAVGTDRVNNEPKMYLIKLDYLGTTLWYKIIGVGNSDGFWVEETADRGFIIGGDIDSGLVNDKVYLVKTDSLGNIQWHKTYTNSDLDQCYCVKQTPDGGYILACRTAPNTNGVWYIKTDPLGNLLWQKVYYDNSIHVFTDEIEVIGDGYITSGTIGLNNNADIYVMRLNFNGDTLWTKRFGGNNTDGGHSVDKVDNEGYIIGGTSRSFNANNKTESYICKLDTYGNLLWQKSYSDIGPESCNSIRYKSSLGYVVTGWTDSLGNDTIMAKMRLLDFNGNTIYENSFLPKSLGCSNSVFSTVESCLDGGFIAAGEADYPGAFVKMYVVKTDSLLYANPIGIIKLTNGVPEKFKLYQNFPNPFNSTTDIEFEIVKSTNVILVIYDVLGNEIENIVKKDLTVGKYRVNWDANTFASGIYFYKLTTDFYTETRKMILIK